MKRFIFPFLLIFISINIHSSNTLYSIIDNDTLKIGNSVIERKYLWNNGQLITHSITDKINNFSWTNKSKTPDFIIHGINSPSRDASFDSRMVPSNKIHPSHLEVEIVYSIDDLSIKRVYSIYEDLQAIRCKTFLKGNSKQLTDEQDSDFFEKTNIESAKDMENSHDKTILEKVDFGGNHWRTKIVKFFDVTDWNNNLIDVKKIIPYRKQSHQGNILFSFNPESDNGFFYLKESPTSDVQLGKNKDDFITEFGSFSVKGIGIDDQDLSNEDWVSTYSYVFGIYDNSDLDALKTLRNYQKNIRKVIPSRDEMVMMNTWGDRSQDSQISERFCLEELDYAAKLGISHFQIDDGWQTGRSPNSAQSGGSFKNIWSTDSYWKVDSDKFPNGLTPIIEKGKELDIEICLWFNPSIENDFENWKDDAQAMIDLYNEYNIRIFKIDGLDIPTKKAEINLRKLFDTVLEKSNNNIVFNLDATAMRRAGYHMFNEYGNIFLENRYTDWGNYYPYMTLRNLWLLSKYAPSEKLQVEFLNKWRNADKYDDMFAPANYSFEYLFAITMVGQPLAWLEGKNLPAEAFELKKVVEKYKNIQEDLHSGIILPIGDEPSGKSWTGFQSLHEDRGYLLVFRENNPNQSEYIRTWFEKGAKIHCIPVSGSGEEMNIVVGDNGVIDIIIPQINDYALYKYEIL